MNAREYLKQGRFLDTQINSKIQQVESLHDLATKATSTLSDMPGGATRNTHRMEDIIIKILMLENEINEDIAALVDLKNEIRSVIKAVEEEELRILLEKRYLNYEPWTDIADDLCIGVDSVYKLHQKALKQVRVPKVL